MSWTAAEAADFLDSRELYGWRFGLDRMHRLLTAMGLPQHRFASIHVVGTNGKSSTAGMTAAILEGHGLRTGAYLSPHVSSWTERIQIGGEPIAAASFGEAMEATAAAVVVVERSLEEDDFITQFEALTAAAFQAFARAGVEVAVVEAGLGGRLDATNVIASKVCVLTSIGLEHTEWLGETEAAIAAEKLAVLRDRSTLVLGALSPDATAVAERVVAERHANVVLAPQDPGPDVELASPGAYQRRNFALAIAAAQEFVGSLDRAAVRSAAHLEVPGRMQLVPGDPPVLFDAAHNPDGVRALLESLPEVAEGRPVVACVAILSDKDAASMLRELDSHVDHFVLTEAGGPRARPAGDLASLCERLGIASFEPQPDPAAALERARALARDRSGLALVSGSLYLLNQLWTERPVPSS